MDPSKPSIPSHKTSLRPASGCRPAFVDSPAVDSPGADLAKSDKLAALGRGSSSDQSEPCRNDPADAPSFVVYCGNEEEVSRGFLIALRAMGVADVEQPPEPAIPPVARAKP
jgi:hypothetical protein